MKISESFDLIRKVLNKKYDVDEYILIYNKMKDEKSKEILFNRVMYDNTKKVEYALNMIKCMYYSTTFKSKEDRKMYEYIKFLQNNRNFSKKICFFGMGYDKNHKDLLMWQFLTLVGQSDNGLYIDAIYNDEYDFEIDLCFKKEMVRNIEEFYTSKIDNDKIYVIIENRFDYIESYLHENGISDENIFKFDNQIIFTRERQYLDEVFVEYSSNEILIDGGSSNLETTLGFIDTVDGKYEKIYAIEPFLPDYNECNRIISGYNLKNIEMVNCGLWSKDQELMFNPIGHGSSNISDNGIEKINCRSIDSILNGQKATIIKMDIEGSEKEALIGATNTIKKYYPILMISVYHKINDIIELAKTVFNIRDDYDLYLRHYSYTKNETVLYFIPQDRRGK